MSHQKSLLALAVLTLASTAGMAQQATGVTISGILDAGVSNTSGLKGGSKKAVISGIMDGSRLIVRGNEDIGGGWRALFMLENRIEVDTGSNSNKPPSGDQLPDRWGNAPTMLGTFAFNFTGLPVPAANQAVLNATVNGGLQQVVSGVGAQLAAASFGVNVGNARFWDRQAYIGLVTPVGAVLAGRQYTPAYELNAAFDIMGTQSALAAGQVAAVPAVIDIRQSNAVQYRIVQGGLTASLMVAAGEGAATQGRFMGGMVMYQGSGFGVGAGINKRDNEAGKDSLRTMTLGASMDLGPGKLSVLLNDVEDKNPSGLSAALAAVSTNIGAVRSAVAGNAALGPLAGVLANQINVADWTERYRQAFVQDSRAYSIGYKLTTGRHTFYTAFNRLDDRTRFNADTDSYGVVYTYSLSKRTDINAVAVHFNNKGLGQAAPGQAGFLGGFTSAAGVDSNNLALGIRHRF